MTAKLGVVGLRQSGELICNGTDNSCNAEELKSNVSAWLGIAVAKHRCAGCCKGIAGYGAVLARLSEDSQG